MKAVAINNQSPINARSTQSMLNQYDQETSISSSNHLNPTASGIPRVAGAREAQQGVRLHQHQHTIQSKPNQPINKNQHNHHNQPNQGNHHNTINTINTINTSTQSTMHHLRQHQRHRLKLCRARPGRRHHGQRPTGSDIAPYATKSAPCRHPRTEGDAGTEGGQHKRGAAQKGGGTEGAAG